MAILTWAIQAENSPAHVGRLLASVLLNEGVVDVAGDSFEVLQDTGSNLNVRVGSGTVGDLAVVQGDSQADQGVYVVESQDATDTVTLSAGDGSNPRIDLIVLRVQDDEADSGGQNASILDVVEGTPASSPSAPALPDNCLLLAEVEVATAASAVTNSDITDMREEALVPSRALPSDEDVPYPLGQVGYGINDSASTAIGSGGQTTLITVNVELRDDRRYRITAHQRYQGSTVANRIGTQRVVVDGTTRASTTFVNTTSAYTVDQHVERASFTPASTATVAVALTCERDAGSATSLLAVGSAAVPGELLVEDIGPV